jgi:hypothetical protein
MRMLFKALGLLSATALMTFGMTVVPTLAAGPAVNQNCPATGGSATTSASGDGSANPDCSVHQTSTQNSGNICGNGNETINHVSVKTGTGDVNGGTGSSSNTGSGTGGAATNTNQAQVTTYVVTTTNCASGAVVGTSTKTVPASQLNLPGTGHPTVAAYNGPNAFLMAGLAILLAIGLGAAAWIRRKGTSAG